MKVGKWRGFWGKWKSFVFEDFRPLGLIDMLKHFWVSMGLMLIFDGDRSKGLLRIVAIEERVEVVGRFLKMQYLLHRQTERESEREGEDSCCWCEMVFRLCESGGCESEIGVENFHDPQHPKFSWALTCYRWVQIPGSVDQGRLI